MKGYCFFLEASLGGLGKWLRLLGHKVEIAPGKISLEMIIKNRQSFFLVTSIETSKILEKVGINYLLLPRYNLQAQMNKLLIKLNLDPELKLDICTLCGVKLIPVKKEHYRDLLPPKVYLHYEEFNLCPSCGRLYWEGDHVKRIRAKWKALLSGISKFKS